jgi:aspartyl-tRNA(Asn)/glutamyl-tRNA(Gln) amidotransferase subunit A
MTDLPLTIREAAGALRAGSVTSVELTRGYLERIERLNPKLGAFITVTADTALEAAARADADLASGVDNGPLQGVPVAVKDILATKDAPTTANSRVLDPAWGEGYDSPVVERLRGAGAVMMGKLVASEFALGMPDPDKGFPMPVNPWNTEHTAAGSSSGTGIALVAGMILGGIGTDTGGSVRGPASANGHSGLKVSFGRVPKWGCVPLGYSLDSIGPMARSAYDCAAMLSVIAGYDARDPDSVDVSVPDYASMLDGSAEGLRIGVPKAYFFDHPSVTDEVREAVLGAVAALEAAGAIVTEIDLPNAELAKEANTITMAGESFAYHREDLASKWSLYGKHTRMSLARGALQSAADYAQAQRFRSYFVKLVTDLMSDLDVLITPTSPTPAQRIDEMSVEGRLTQPSFTGPWNLTGRPALAIPCGFSTSGLPMSMQIVGKPFDEATVLRAGDAYQQLTDWHLRMPEYVLDGTAVLA